MKQLTLILAVVGLMSCNSGNKTIDANSPQIVSEFLNDVNSLESVESEEGKNQIELFQAQAEKEADDVVEMDRDNIREVLQGAKSFQSVVITVGNHTIVKVIDMDNCSHSNSWKACMPLAEGFIKKGSLDFQEDYINNIIGRPDNQVRKVYLFK